MKSKSNALLLWMEKRLKTKEEDKPKDKLAFPLVIVLCDIRPGKYRLEVTNNEMMMIFRQG